MDRHSLDARPYWEALRQRRLVIQQCGHCGKPRHYPQPMCPHCHSTRVEWRAIAGEGRVHSWTVTHQTPIPRFARQVPYVFATVDLPERVRMAAPLRGVAPEEMRIGMAVTVVFETTDEGEVLPALIRAPG